MLFFGRSRFGFLIDDIMSPAVAGICKHFHRFISCYLTRTTLALLEMISGRDGVFCLNQFDDDLVRFMCRLYL